MPALFVINRNKDFTWSIEVNNLRLSAFSIINNRSLCFPSLSNSGSRSGGSWRRSSVTCCRGLCVDGFRGVIAII